MTPIKGTLIFSDSLPKIVLKVGELPFVERYVTVDVTMRVRLYVGSLWMGSMSGYSVHTGFDVVNDEHGSPMFDMKEVEE